MSDQLSLVYAAISHPVRRGIVERLAGGDCTVAELRKPLNISAAAVSRHLRVLTEAGLIKRRPSGRNQVCSLHAAALAEAGDWCRQQREFWSAPLDSWEGYLAGEEQ